LPHGLEFIVTHLAALLMALPSQRREKDELPLFMGLLFKRRRSWPFIQASLFLFSESTPIHTKTSFADYAADLLIYEVVILFGGG
jgi:hypothetical protein